MGDDWGDFSSAGAMLVSAGLNYLGNENTNETNQELTEQQIALQREFAYNGISWKVQDAKNSGIHPLYALGANTLNYQPVSTGTVNSLGQLGQDVSRAITAVQTARERKQALMLAEERVENARLNNEVLRTQLASEKAKLSAQVGPPMADVNSVELKPSVQVTNLKGRPDVEAATSPEVKWFRTKDGGLMPAFSEPISEAMEENPIAKLGWSWRNYITPLWDKKNRPPKSMLPAGYTHWQWKGTGYYPAKGKDPGSYVDRAKSRATKSGLYKKNNRGSSGSW